MNCSSATLAGGTCHTDSTDFTDFSALLRLQRGWRGLNRLLAVLARSRKSRKLIPAGFFSGCGGRYALRVKSYECAAGAGFYSPARGAREIL